MRKQKIRRNNTTGITGVSFCKTQRLWCAHISTDVGRLVFYVRDFFEACCIRKSLELEHGYEQRDEPRTIRHKLFTDIWK